MIDITKPVRTKDGQRVEIFSDKGREPYPLIGYIGDSTALGTWTKDGMFFEQESSHHDIENYEPRPVRWNCLDPLPEPQPEEWAAEKAAFAAGRAIQYRGSESSMWHDTVIPTWQPCCQYRIKPEPPEPQWVQLGSKDVPCGSSVRMVTSQSGLEIESMVLRSSKNGIYICGQVGNIYEVGYDELFEDWQIKRPGGEWKPCKKEVQV
jgi:hypothetical protein